MKKITVKDAFLHANIKTLFLGKRNKLYKFLKVINYMTLNYNGGDSRFCCDANGPPRYNFERFPFARISVRRLKDSVQIVTFKPPSKAYLEKHGNLKTVVTKRQKKWILEIRDEIDFDKLNDLLSTKQYAYFCGAGEVSNNEKETKSDNMFTRLAPEPRHIDLSRKFTKWLKRQSSLEDIETEVRVDQLDNKQTAVIDIQANVPNFLQEKGLPRRIYIELKTSADKDIFYNFNSNRMLIRNAVGQLLDYVHFGYIEPDCELWIVVDNKISLGERSFIDSLNEDYPNRLFRLFWVQQNSKDNKVNFGFYPTKCQLFN